VTLRLTPEPNLRQLGFFTTNGPLSRRRELAKPLREFTEALISEQDSLSKIDREFIGVFVSGLNDSAYMDSLERNDFNYDPFDGEQTTRKKAGVALYDISDKLKSLLKIAGSIQRGGRYHRTMS
jgi:hypothetical protein